MLWFASHFSIVRIFIRLSVVYISSIGLTCSVAHLYFCRNWKSTGFATTSTRCSILYTAHYHCTSLLAPSNHASYQIRTTQTVLAPMLIMCQCESDTATERASARYSHLFAHVFHHLHKHKTGLNNNTKRISEETCRSSDYSNLLHTNLRPLFSHGGSSTSRSQLSWSNICARCLSANPISLKTCSLTSR